MTTHRELRPPWTPRRAPAKFDELYAEAAPVVRAGEHARESPPREGGRWPITVVLRPGPAIGKQLDALTQDAIRVAGPGHWPTGSLGSAHVTVTALEGYRASVPDGDPAVAGWAEALCRAADVSRPVRLAFTGLILTRSSVMLAARSVDGSAEAFRASLREALVHQVGERGWAEWDVERDIWYANLIHFADGLADAPALVEWVDARRELDLGTAQLDTAELWRYVFAQGYPQPPQVLTRRSLVP